MVRLIGPSPLNHSIVPRFFVRVLATHTGSPLTSNRMLSVNLVIIVESIRSIATHKGKDTNDFFIPAVAAVASALGWFSTHSFAD